MAGREYAISGRGDVNGVPASEKVFCVLRELRKSREGKDPGTRIYTWVEMKNRVSRHLWRCVVVTLATTGAAPAQPVPDLGALTLPAAESMLPSMNRDIALARRVLQQAQADVITAGQRPNPQFSWTTQIRHNP